jgi:hypothetical protein
VSTNYAFPPETVEALATAFHEAWDFLLTDPHFAVLSKTVLQRRLSACLMQLAEDGEQDPARLANDAIRNLRRKTHRARARQFPMTPV